MKYLNLIASSLLALVIAAPTSVIAQPNTSGKPASSIGKSVKSSKSKSSKSSKASKSAKAKSSKSSKSKSSKSARSSSSKSVSSSSSVISASSSAQACAAQSSTDATPVQLGFNLASGSVAFLRLSLNNASAGVDTPQVNIANADVQLMAATGSSFIYLVNANDYLPATSQVSIYLGYTQFDSTTNVTRIVSLYDTASAAMNAVNSLTTTETILVDAAHCGAGSASSVTSSSSLASESSSSYSSSSAPSCEAIAGQDAGTTSLGIGMGADQQLYLSLQLSNANFTTPVGLSLENASVMEVFGTDTKRIFMITSNQSIPGESALQVNYGYQQLNADQSVERVLGTYETLSQAINTIYPMTMSAELLIDASGCGQ